MLLFILFAPRLRMAQHGFNTSHVTLYQFQKMCRIKSKSCFNTSHVTLYPFGHHFLFWNGLFQYISCYSLSGYSFLMRKQFPVSIHLMLLFIAKQLPDGRFSDEFQYISYYSLSITIQNQFGFQYSFNTSHVTLYRLSYRNSYQLHLGFNTSHVTLYHSCFAGAGANCSKFQYISLYHPC